MNILRLAELGSLIPDPSNANSGTERGRDLVNKSIQEGGAGRSILIDKNGMVIAGNKTLEQAKALGLDGVLIVPTDGKQLVAVQRTDLDLKLDPRAKRLAILDNRSSEIGLEWSPAELLAQVNQFGQEVITSGIFDPEEWFAITGESPDFEPVPEETQPALDTPAMVKCKCCGYEFIPPKDRKPKTDSAA